MSTHNLPVLGCVCVCNEHNSSFIQSCFFVCVCARARMRVRVERGWIGCGLQLITIEKCTLCTRVSVVLGTFGVDVHVRVRRHKYPHTHTHRELYGLPG